VSQVDIRTLLTLDLLSILSTFVLYFLTLDIGWIITSKMSPPSAIDVDVQAIDDTTAITIPNPLTLEDVTARREATGKLIAGVAAVANVEQFKGDRHHNHKPKAKRWDRKCQSGQLSRTKLTKFQTA
jgi:hypothetical protein